MSQLPNVLRAMQSIQRDTDEIRENLERLKVFDTSNTGLVDLCTGTLDSIWRTANDYEKALPQIVQPQNRRENPVGTVHNPGDPPVVWRSTGGEPNP